MARVAWPRYTCNLGSEAAGAWLFYSVGLGIITYRNCFISSIFNVVRICFEYLPRNCPEDEKLLMDTGILDQII